jgi:hypothetical protein
MRLCLILFIFRGALYSFETSKVSELLYKTTIKQQITLCFSFMGHDLEHFRSLSLTVPVLSRHLFQTFQFCQQVYLKINLMFRHVAFIIIFASKYRYAFTRYLYYRYRFTDRVSWSCFRRCCRRRVPCSVAIGLRAVIPALPAAKMALNCSSCCAISLLGGFRTVRCTLQ